MPDPSTAAHDPPVARRATVVVPALDEAPTIAGVVAAAREAGAARVLVVDSGSTDGTADRAREAGADCVDARALGPGGPVRGKGEALWRALPEVDTDLTVLLDGDLTVDGPTFLGRLLAPLVAEGRLFAKADFRRRHEPAASPGAGRITTLVARPVLANLFPSLADLDEPLSGQVAAPTELLLRLPFEPDYGLEIGMLIDVHRAVGPAAIAHPHCGDLAHVPQGDQALGTMARQVLRAVLRRVGPVELPADAPGLLPPHTS